MTQDISCLLEKGNASIKYRTQLEILSQKPDSNDLVGLYEQILEDPQVLHCFSLVQEDGSLGTLFHTTGEKDPFEGAEINIRFLCEMGVKSDHPLLKAGFEALLKPEGTKELAPKNEAYSDGGELIIGSLFARAGIENRIARKRCEIALDSFAQTFSYKNYEQVATEFRQQLVYKDGVRWPCIYDLKALAFTRQWRSVENLMLLERAIDHLQSFVPYVKLYQRCGNTFYAPAEALQDQFLPDIENLQKGEAHKWWSRMELVARCGVKPKTFISQLVKLQKIDNDSLSQTFNDGCIRGWNAYHGLKLMQDWKENRRLVDMLFRKSLIIKHSS
jgi:hypothetical protein